MKSPRVAVLLAAYNGMRWLPSQMESILSQSGVGVTIYVSVDASSDGTEEWVTQLALDDPRVVMLPCGERFGGAARNFFRLLKDVDFSAFDYVALSDQDDVWLEDKLLTAHHNMVEGNYDACSCNVMAFWPDGRQMLIDKAQPLAEYDYFFEAAGPGCTYVLRADRTAQFKAFMLRHWEEINTVALHDWMIYAFFRSRGYAWLIDAGYKMMYRQHGGNQVGANAGWRAMWGRLKLLHSGWYRQEVIKVARLAGAESNTFGRRLLTDNWGSRLYLLRHIAALRRRPRDRFFLFMMILSGIF